MESELDAQQRAVLFLRYGHPVRRRTHLEVARKLGVGETDVARVERTALRALRAAALRAALAKSGV